MIIKIYILGPFLPLSVSSICFIDLSSKDSPDEDVFFEEGKSLHQITKVALPPNMFHITWIVLFSFIWPLIVTLHFDIVCLSDIFCQAVPFLLAYYRLLICLKFCCLFLCLSAASDTQSGVSDFTSLSGEEESRAEQETHPGHFFFSLI